MNPDNPSGRNLIGALLLCAAISLAGSSRAADKTVWKMVTDAQLKLDGRPMRTWNVYRAEKKKTRILVLLGRRYLLLDTKERSLYELKPSDLKARRKSLESRDSENQGRLIPSSEWMDRDIGPARLVRVRLGDYGRVLEVQLPHPADLRVLY